MFQWQNSSGTEQQRVELLQLHTTRYDEYKDLQLLAPIFSSPEFQHVVEMLNEFRGADSRFTQNIYHIQDLIRAIQTDIENKDRWKEEIRQLQLQIDTIDAAPPPTESSLSEEDVREIINRFDWLEDEIKSYSDNAIRLRTKHIWAVVEISIGRIKIPVPPHLLVIRADKQIRAVPIKDNGLYYFDGPNVHPHIINAIPCLGDFTLSMDRAFELNDLASILVIYKTFLDTVNHNDTAGRHWVDYFLTTYGGLNQYDLREIDYGDISLIENRIVTDHETVTIPEEYFV